MKPNTAVLEQVKIATYSRNDFHGHDAVGTFETVDGHLRGIIICDGVSQTLGSVASRIMVQIMNEAFSYAITHDGNPAELESVLDDLMYAAPQNMRFALLEEGVKSEDAATTVMIGATDGNYIYVYYLGDGTILHFNGDLQASASYLIPYSRGGKLEGYVSSKGVSSLPTFLAVRQSFPEGSFLIMATDGISFNNPDIYKSLWLHLHGVRMEKFSLEDGLQHFMSKLEVKDDATIGVMYVPAPDYMKDSDSK